MGAGAEGRKPLWQARGRLSGRPARGGRYRIRSVFMTTQIKFGTSGWRAVMAEEFTFANVRRGVDGIARYVVSQKKEGARVIVGRDPRFLGETFCSMAAEILASHGITPLVVAEPAPTPALAHAVMHNQADG